MFKCRVCDFDDMIQLDLVKHKYGMLGYWHLVMRQLPLW